MPDADDASRFHTTDDGSDLVSEQRSETSQPFSGPVPIRFSLRTILFAMAAMAALLWGLRAFIERQHRLTYDQKGQQIAGNLASIALALVWEDSNKRSFTWPPPIPKDSNGQPLNSWRFQFYPIVPDLDASTPYKHDLNARWDDPVNKQARDDWPPSFCWGTESRDTIAFGVVGSDTAFDPAAVSNFLNLPPNLIFVIEVANSNTHWMQPGDYNVTDLLAANGRLGDKAEGILPDRIHVLFGDGEVWALDPDTPMSALKPFLTVTSARTASRNKQLAPFQVMRHTPFDDWLGENPKLRSRGQTNSSF